MRLFKAGLLGAIGFSTAVILTLRVTGLEPRYIDPRTPAFAENNRTAGPGLWLKGEAVQETVTNWDFINEVDHPVRGNSIMLETRTWYGIPHSVTVNARPRGEDLYLSGSAQGDRLGVEFPRHKSWWTNIERDPRVRLKVDGKIYEATVALVRDYDEVVRLFGNDPITIEVDGDDNEQVTGIRYYWRVFQRNIPTYDDGFLR
ncbi:nitroreductase/quinone reductase family protein [Gammaproteobacteria bacterium]|nr:nitroreductase/quinone reductase family protein [Gammaproteobacteria bacterium]|tara:strand:- start:580 stop:1185 length:606 start_codon:yes stop_codon:yes gene_type:complete